MPEFGEFEWVLKKQLNSLFIGLKTLVILSLSSMLGSGIFLLPAFAHEVVGPGMWFAFILAGSVVIASAYSKAELASAMPQSGGFYVYAERTYGHISGTISGLGLFASFMLKSAFALVGFAAYMKVITATTALTMSTRMPSPWCCLPSSSS